MTATDDLLTRNHRQRESWDGQVPGPPSLRTAVVTCMDCRIDPVRTLDLGTGEAHVIRNAGGAVTEDVLRSLSVSQRKLGTTEVVLMHHTRCGMATFAEGEFKQELEEETGQRPTWSVETFADTEQDLRQSARRVRQSPFLTETTSVRAFVHDIDSDELTEVSLD
ncbi:MULTISPECIES: beta-class carbonic anhydrase [Actinopolyspora]|uniref:carbonic anhydrase n=1 Tax=Actinopolyspora saharensis TaxID=995062 RepID=A0A1H1F486_9ACTN|nr:MULTISPECIES: carbonic anhydrase [Actinopolyspora]NHD18365.1 carbonic anhydrase [Actinopolyspora sp. BKK2]NHE76956.1 carbonic anhydrase [Actinopolyspora sp. BKK1]SDQ95619.1 carbonic anhydrase [Actinopolyspora saharensis]